jgi:hypothetical protein
MRIITLLEQLQRPSEYFCTHRQREFGNISLTSTQTNILLVSSAFMHFRIV